MCVYLDTLFAKKLPQQMPALHSYWRIYDQSVHLPMSRSPIWWNMEYYVLKDAAAAIIARTLSLYSCLLRSRTLYLWWTLRTENYRKGLNPTYWVTPWCKMAKSNKDMGLRTCFWDPRGFAIRCGRALVNSSRSQQFSQLAGELNT